MRKAILTKCEFETPKKRVKMNRLVKQPIGYSMTSNKPIKQPIGFSMTSNKPIKQPIGFSMTSNKLIKKSTGYSMTSNRPVKKSTGFSMTSNRSVKPKDFARSEAQQRTGLSSSHCKPPTSSLMSSSWNRRQPTMTDSNQEQKKFLFI
jgi:hypothetical protein